MAITNHAGSTAPLPRHDIVVEPPNSAMQRWHPTCKVLSIASIAIAIAAINSLGIATIAAALSMVAIPLARLPLGLVGKRLGILTALLLPLFVLMGLTVPPLDVAIGPFRASAEGVRLAAQVTLKCLAIALLLTALVETTPAIQIFKSLRRIGLPGRLAEILLTAYRLSFSLGTEFRKLRRAATSRGWSPSIAPRQLQTLGMLTGSFVARGLDRSDRVYAAMLARGYDGAPRTLATAAPRRRDYAKLIASAGLAAALVLAGHRDVADKRALTHGNPITTESLSIGTVLTPQRAIAAENSAYDSAKETDGDPS